jgi:Mn2+/Fe2+ NRAMP family transporter
MAKNAELQEIQTEIMPDITNNTKELLKKVGPGLVWSAAAIGTGELILTTRNSAVHGLTFAWMILFLIFIKFFINYEVGRYTIFTGQTILGGVSKLSKFLVFWFAFLPITWQTVTISSYTVSGATLVSYVFGGNLAVITVIITIFVSSLLYFGKYSILEKICTLGTCTMTLCVMISAIAFTPLSGYAELLSNMVIPRLPSDTQGWTDMMSLTGFVGAGCIGTIWYSYWIREKGYGLSLNNKRKDEYDNIMSVTCDDTPDEIRKGRNWLKLLKIDLGVGTVLTFIVCICFFLCGYAVLRPRGLAPSGMDLVLVQAQIVVELVGPLGEWIYIIAAAEVMFAAYLTFEDGTVRVWNDASRILAPKRMKNIDDKKGYRIWVIVFTVQSLISLFFSLMKFQPLVLLQAQSIIDGAYNLPILAIVVLILNLKVLPDTFKPSKGSIIFNILGIIFFIIFAIYYTVIIF